MKLELFRNDRQHPFVNKSLPIGGDLAYLLAFQRLLAGKAHFVNTQPDQLAAGLQQLPLGCDLAFAQRRIHADDFFFQVQASADASKHRRRGRALRRDRRQRFRERRGSRFKGPLPSQVDFALQICRGTIIRPIG